MITDAMRWMKQAGEESQKNVGFEGTDKSIPDCLERTEEQVGTGLRKPKEGVSVSCVCRE